jgi:hypothetical protein
MAGTDVDRVRLRCGAAVARRAHTPEVVGSIPTIATKPAGTHRAGSARHLVRTDRGLRRLVRRRSAVQRATHGPGRSTRPVRGHRRRADWSGSSSMTTGPTRRLAARISGSGCVDNRDCHLLAAGTANSEMTVARIGASVGSCRAANRSASSSAARADLRHHNDPATLAAAATVTLAATGTGATSTDMLATMTASCAFTRRNPCRRA